ncbi:MAG: amino acid permease, partial [Victivallales bacterium]|nr:amino acid permease [Victivallales bacterium]
MARQITTIKQDKPLTRLDVWAMAFGCMVGWGAFVMPGGTFLPLAGPAGTVISMAASLAVMLVIASCVSYLMVRSPKAGGIYSYTKEAFGRDHAFLCSWFMSLSYLTIVFLNGTALFLVIRTLLGNIAQDGGYYMVAGNPVYHKEVVLSVLALAGIGSLFIVARSFLQKLTTVLALVLLLGSLVITAFCLPRMMTTEIWCSFGYSGVNKCFAVFSLVVLAPWAFSGFEVTTFGTSRLTFPVKRVWPVVSIAIILAALVYASMALVSVSTLPDGYSSWSAYISDLGNLHGIPSVPTFNAARAVLGRTGIIIIVLTSISAILTGIIEAFRAMLNLLSTMADDKILSGKFSKSIYSILFIMTLSILISFLGRNTLNWFVDLTSLGAIIAYGYTSAAAFKIAKNERNKKIMAMGIVGTFISIVFGVIQLVPQLAALNAMDGEAFLLLSLWSLLGFAFYWRTTKLNTQKQYRGTSIVGMMLFALLVYTAMLWFDKMLMRKNSIAEMRSAVVQGSGVVLLIIFIGLFVMQYIQEQVRRMHEDAERENIRVREGNIAKSQFLFNVSHDIRTPMNAILGYVTLALKEPEGMLRSYLVKIEKSSRQLLSLLNDILEMSHIENARLKLELQPTNLCFMLERLGDLFTEQMKQKQLAFSVHTSQVRNRHVWCDRRNLNRVFLNIISNAYKFTPKGGSVSVSVNELASDEKDYGSYEFRVRDSGIGMSKKFVTKIFNAFERERTSTASGLEGAGLGLAIAKRIIDCMGGTIDVSTSPGQGTEMIIRVKLRIASEKDMQKETEVENAQVKVSVDFSGRNLLLVEDNEVNQEIAKMLLEQMGFNVETAANGEIAVKKGADSQPGHYEAILMDIQMPV